VEGINVDGDLPDTELEAHAGIEGGPTPAVDPSAVETSEKDPGRSTATSPEEDRLAVDAAPPSPESAAEPGDADGPWTEESDLANPERKIWIVTTAGLPWRTGTAVNPLLRALYLARGRPKDGVTLVVPWLDSEPDQRKLYGQAFDKPDSQEAWIREYCRSRCHCPDEESRMRVRFWKGTYNDGFGSIFPTEDICSLIPEDEADVAILEEPEHLNWFRVPELMKDRVPELVKEATAAAAAGTGLERQQDTNQKNVLGWKAKFKHVVGILHTNYAAYIRQYGMGTSLVTAPALNALSSLVVRAYCHRIIRLSNCLPSFDPTKEVTENVHGVRSEFFILGGGGGDAASASGDTTPTTAIPVANPSKAPSEETPPRPDVAPVYFIGKLIWVRVMSSASVELFLPENDDREPDVLH
jgi:hypothetical protein